MKPPRPKKCDGLSKRAIQHQSPFAIARRTRYTAAPILDGKSRGSSVVERTLGKGEAESSILSRGTIPPRNVDIGLSGQRYVALHVVIDIAKLRIENRQAFEVVADCIFIGHSVAAVDLDRFLSNMMRGLANANLCR